MVQSRNTEKNRSLPQAVRHRRSVNGHQRGSRQFRRPIRSLLVCSLAVITGGCGLMRRIPPGKHDTKASYHDGTALQIEYPDVTRCIETPPTVAAESSARPYSLDDPSQIPARDLTLEEAILMAVEQSPVLRTIGGTIVNAPNTAATVYDPGLIAASPNLGTEAALAAFDAQYNGQLLFLTQDVPRNIVAFDPAQARFFPGVQDVQGTAFVSDLSKQTAQGATFALRHIVNYSRNKVNRSVAFYNAFDGYFEAEWRQPLMQGAGTTYNRIAGPSSVPGQYNGVLIARVNEDVALADFEAALIQLVADVEQAYWDLVVAYRVLGAQVRAREAAQETWQVQQASVDVGNESIDAEAQARSQFYQFQAQVETSLGGTGGLYDAEQRLRYLVGLPASDGHLLRPVTAPLDAKVVFDWESALGQALDRRVEIRRQLLAVKRRELELTAARLNRRPRLDMLAQYRWNGLGNHLFGQSTGDFVDPSTSLPNPDSSLYGTIFGGNYQQGQVGLEMNLPVGLRAASVAVAHARLSLRRERALLAETELRISHDLANAARQIELTNRLQETNYNRFLADVRQINVLTVRLEEGVDEKLAALNALLQAQRQAVASATDFYRALGNYNLAIRDFHRQKGSLLAYNQVYLSEGPWARGAAQDAYQVGRFLTPRHAPEKVMVPRPISRGLFNPTEVQHTAPVESIAPPLPPQPQQAIDDGDAPAQPDRLGDLISLGPSWE